MRSQSISSGNFVYRRPLENSIVVRSINKYSKSFSIVWLNWMSAHSTHSVDHIREPGTTRHRHTLFAQRSVFCPSPCTRNEQSVFFFVSFCSVECMCVLSDLFIQYMHNVWMWICKANVVIFTRVCVSDSVCKWMWICVQFRSTTDFRMKIKQQQQQQHSMRTF